MKVGQTQVLKLFRSGRQYTFPISDTFIKDVVGALMKDDGARRHIMNAVAEARLTNELVEALAHMTASNEKYQKVFLRELAMVGFAPVIVPSLPICAHEGCALYEQHNGG